MTPQTRPALVVSVGMTASAQTVWAHRQAFGADPEVHLVSDSGVPLTAGEARALVPWAADGLGYTDTFFDGLASRRFSMVFPLLSVNDGTIQGLLEFLGVPYAGCGMTGVLLAGNHAYSRAVLDSLEVPFWKGEAASVSVAVLGNDELVTASSDAGAEAAAVLVYRGLGLSGWALIDVVSNGGRWYWRRVQVQPDLAPGAPFLALLQSRGLAPASVMQRVLGWGQVRHDAEVGLKNIFKDRI